MMYYNDDNVQTVRQFRKHSDDKSAMAAFKAKGVTPLAMAGAEYPSQHLFYELALSKADRAMVNAYQLYQGDFDFHNPAFTYAADKMVEWVKKGYIDKDCISLKAEDMGLQFTNGKAPIMVSGSWWYGRFVSEITGFNWSIGLFPGNKMSRVLPETSGWCPPTARTRTGLRLHRHHVAEGHPDAAWQQGWHSCGRRSGADHRSEDQGSESTCSTR
jgi:ABC-type glycerol-3-phosphate transport system substrate-binding protein